MFKRHRAGFLTANNLIALTILTVALTFLMVNVAAIKEQRQQMDQALTVARLAKEVSTQVTTGQPEATISRQGLRAEATPNYVRVYSRSGAHETPRLYPCRCLIGADRFGCDGTAD